MHAILSKTNLMCIYWGKQSRAEQRTCLKQKIDQGGSSCSEATAASTGQRLLAHSVLSPCSVITNGSVKAMAASHTSLLDKCTWNKTMTNQRTDVWRSFFRWQRISGFTKFEIHVMLSPDADPLIECKLPTAVTSAEFFIPVIKH